MSRVRKVLYWCENFWPTIGGVEVLSVELLRALRARDYEIMVLASPPGAAAAAAAAAGDAEMFEGMRVVRVPFARLAAGQDLAGIRQATTRIAAEIASFDPDVVHLQSFGAAALFRRLTPGALRLPTLLTLHAPVPRGERVLAEAVLRSVHLTAAVSRAMYEDGVRAVPDLADRIRVVLNALPDPGLAISRPRFDPPRLLCIGRTGPEKGFDLALDALARLRTVRPDVRLSIAGEGLALERLKAAAQAAGVAGLCEFVGWVAPERVPSFIAGHDIVLVPSRWREPFALVALQAAQMARPVIAARVGGLPEVVEHEVTGLLVPPEDPGALASAILELVDAPERAAALGVAAHHRARTTFDFERMVASYVELYEETVALSARAFAGSSA